MYGWNNRRVALADLIAFACSAPMRELAARVEADYEGKDLLLISSRFKFTRDMGLQATTQASVTEGQPAPTAAGNANAP